MNPVFIGLVLLDALALWAIILSRKAPWWLVLIAILLVSTINFSTIHAFDSGSGWPVKAQPTGDNLFIACNVIEPDQDTTGAIYLYVVPLKTTHHILGYSSAAQTPRSFQEPYSRKLQEQCVKAAKRSSSGVPTLVSKAKGHSKRGEHPPGVFVFYNLPKPTGQRKVMP